MALVAKRLSRCTDINRIKKTGPVHRLASLFKVDPRVCSIKNYRCTALAERLISKLKRTLVFYTLCVYQSYNNSAFTDSTGFEPVDMATQRCLSLSALSFACFESFCYFESSHVNFLSSCLVKFVYISKFMNYPACLDSMPVSVESLER